MMFRQLLCIVSVVLVAAKPPCHQYSETIESPCNTVVSKEHGYEIREYAGDRNEFFTDAHIATESFLVASKKGFDANFAYISGHNSQNATIPMTSPVIFRPADCPEGCAGGWRVGFFLPTAYDTADQVPKPDCSKIDIVAVPSKGNFAVTTFGGFATSKTFAHQTHKLFRALKRDNVTVVDDDWKVTWASYDSPFVLFNRHNEVLVHVEGGGSADAAFMSEDAVDAYEQRLHAYAAAGEQEPAAAEEEGSTAGMELLQEA